MYIWLVGLVDTLFFIPKGEGNVLPAMGVGHTRDAVFAPPEGSRPGVIVGEI